MRPPNLSVHIPSGTRISEPVSTGVAVSRPNCVELRLSVFWIGNADDAEHHPDHEAHGERQRADDQHRQCLPLLAHDTHPLAHPVRYASMVGGAPRRRHPPDGGAARARKNDAGGGRHRPEELSRAENRGAFARDQSRPCSVAITAACTREPTSSLRSTCCTWILTVVSAMPRSRPISLLRGAARDAAQDFLLARRQLFERRRGSDGRRRGRRRRRVAIRRDELAGHLVGDDRLAAHRAHDRGDERVALDRLQQVAARAAAQRGGEILLVLADGEHQDARGRRRLAQRRAAHRRR